MWPGLGDTVLFVGSHTRTGPSKTKPGHRMSNLASVQGSGGSDVLPSVKSGTDLVLSWSAVVNALGTERKLGVALTHLITFNTSAVFNIFGGFFIVSGLCDKWIRFNRKLLLFQNHSLIRDVCHSLEVCLDVQKPSSSLEMLASSDDGDIE